MSTEAFDNTATARWRSRLVGTGPDVRGHWRTKVSYYRAASDILSAGADAVPSWRNIVDAVLPRGSRSTFYDVTGGHASHPLIRELLATDTADGAQIQIAFCYRRHNAVDQLIDEAKVWSYWPYRERWLAHNGLDGGGLDGGAAEPGMAEPGMAEPRMAEPGMAACAALAESLGPVVAGWARRNSGLAAALDGAPPVCAVEDLTLVRRGQLAATRAFTALAHTVAHTVAHATE